MSRDRIRRLALHFVFCVAGSVGLGFAFFGQRIFEAHLIYFQCVAYGVVASVFVAAWPIARRRGLVLLGVLAYLGFVKQTHSETPVLLARDAIGVLSVIGAVGLGLLGDRAFPSLKLGKCFLWGAAFALACSLGILLMLLVARHLTTANPNVVWAGAQIAAVIGVGVGLGNELAHLIAARLWYSDERSLVVDQ